MLTVVIMTMRSQAKRHHCHREGIMMIVQVVIDGITSTNRNNTITPEIQVATIFCYFGRGKIQLCGTGELSIRCLRVYVTLWMPKVPDRYRSQIQSYKITAGLVQGRFLSLKCWLHLDLPLQVIFHLSLICVGILLLLCVLSATASNCMQTVMHL